MAHENKRVLFIQMKLTHDNYVFKGRIQWVNAKWRLSDQKIVSFMLEQVSKV